MYCVYLTSYTGKKLPPFYIGSSSVARIEAGYRGSVTSKAYSQLWKQCLLEEPHEFKTRIIQTFDTRQEAFARECELQEYLDVVKSPLYVNKAFARPDGYFSGGDQCGAKNPMWGKSNSETAKAKISKALTGRKKSDATKERMKAARALVEYSEHALENMREAGTKRRGANHVYFGKKRPEEVGAKISASKAGKSWWTDGSNNKFCIDPPSSVWTKGLTRKVAKKT